MSRAHRRSRVIAVAAVCAAFALTLSLAGCATVVASEAGAAAAEVAQTANPLDAGGLQDPRTASSEQPISMTPVRIRIPSVGVDSALESLSLGADGGLQAPVDYDSAGWYAAGVAPGAVGPAIIAGHVDSPTAPAVFARIGELTAGAEVIVAMSDGSELTFQMTGSAQSAKSNFPTDAVYSNVPTPQLRLITCAGDFDEAVGHYTDNLIVFASLRG